MNMSRPGQRRTSTRRGLVLIPVMVCLLLVTLLGSVLLKQAGHQRALVRAEERRMQAEWLAESALARASARLRADRGYQGETWEIPADVLGGDAAVVRIIVDIDKSQPSYRRVRVEADTPRDDERRARVSKTLNMDLGPETSGGSS